MNVDTSAKALAAYSQRNSIAARVTTLEDYFEKTEVYWEFRKRVFNVLALREARLRVGKGELKCVALIGPAGAGKSRIAAEVIAEHHALAEAMDDRQFGTRILSVIVPGRERVKETLNAILRALGHPARGRRDEDYLAQLVVEYLKECRIAALHLDEVQDIGRYKTNESMEVFLKRFRNMMQGDNWPVCLILTGTSEGREMVNQDTPFSRRLKPIEMKPATFAKDGNVLRKALMQLFEDADDKDAGILPHNEFIKILIHAAAGRFGVAMEMAIEAIGECLADDNDEIDMSYFADAYALRMDCDDEMNPFVAENWKTIDTITLLQRFEEDRQARRRPAKKNLNRYPVLNLNRPPGRFFVSWFWDCGKGGRFQDGFLVMENGN